MTDNAKSLRTIQVMVSVREFNPMPPELGEERQSQTHSKTNG
jgi:hypothetical protein